MMSHEDDENLPIRQTRRRDVDRPSPGVRSLTPRRLTPGDLKPGKL
jgi:hypothetical protein